MNFQVKVKFDSYPSDVAIELGQIRQLIFTVAKEEGIEDLIETLKWGEPSYIAKTGSAIRFDYKAKLPSQYCLYFNCKTTLIATFKEVYPHTFQYCGNRAIIFALGQQIPTKALAHCISMALRYKQLKHKPLLGA